MVAIEGNERMRRSLGVTQGGQERVALPKWGWGAKCDEINFKEGELKEKGVKWFGSGCRKPKHTPIPSPGCLS